MIKYLLGKASTGKFRFAVITWDEEWKELENTELGNKEFLDYLIENYYSSWSDFEDILEGQDFKVTIHD